MCGITGIASVKRGAPPVERVIAMRDALVHRGPDDAGLWSSPDQLVTLGARRLAILDLSPAGHQPMVNAANDIAVAFNGEIYNCRLLSSELEGLRARFNGHSDTEVILRAYEAWGQRCLERLRGMFAIAIWDRRRGVLMLARDRAGEKPLFYFSQGGRLLFASELKALLIDPSVPRELDPRALEHYMAYGYAPRDLCILRGVKKLPQGHRLTFDLQSGAIEVSQYWALPSASLRPSREDSAVYQFEQLLADSVQEQLLADVPVGILLSGGVDSSLVTAVASEVSSRVNTFTVSFPGSGEFDEGPFARKIAAHFGTQHHELVAEPASVQLLPLLARQFDEPIADASIIPTFLLSRAVRAEVKVALGGDGGDELFGGYPYYSVLIREAELASRIPSSMRRAVGYVAERLPRGVRGRERAIGLSRDSAFRYSVRNRYFDPWMRRLLIGASGANGEDPEQFKISLCNGGTVLRQITAADFQSYLVDDILVKVDRASMLTSLEVRAPFLDQRIIEFAFALPDDLRATVTARKILLRHLAKRLLPPEFDAARKHGFSIPLEQWFDSFAPYAQSVLLDPGQRLFEQSAVRRLFDHGRRHAHRLFALTMFELWRREYRVSTL